MFVMFVNCCLRWWSWRERNCCRTYPCEIVQDLRHPTTRSNSLSVSLQLCIACRFYSLGGYLSAIADVHHVRKTTASIQHWITLHKYCRLDSRLSEFVNFPNHALVQQSFYDYGQFPRIIGCIDGTHIKIKKPSQNGHVYMMYRYINRKNVDSINVLLVYVWPWWWYILLLGEIPRRMPRFLYFEQFSTLRWVLWQSTVWFPPGGSRLSAKAVVAYASEWPTKSQWEIV